MHPLVRLLREMRQKGDGRLSLCRSESDHPCTDVCGACRAIEKRAEALEKLETAVTIREVTTHESDL